VAHGNGTPVQEAVLEIESSTAVDVAVSLTMGEVGIGGTADLTGPMVGAPSLLPHMGATTAPMDDDDDAAEEPEVILGHLILRALGDVSLSEAMGKNPLGTKPDT
jgi:hypothetical protein